MPKLLIADSSPMMHRIMELTFAPEGLQVVTALDGEQAISLLPIARPDVVIADHALTRRSGYEVAEFIREHSELGRIPVLLLASPFEPLDRERAEAAGVAGEISKPFDPVQLVTRVRDLLARKDVAPVEPAPAPDREAAPGLKLVTSAAPPARGALDDYFDRLDAALAKLDDQGIERTGAGGSRIELSGVDGIKVPTLDEILGTPAPPVEEDASGSAGADSGGATLIAHPLGGAYADAGPEPADAGDDDLGSLVDALEALRSRNANPTPTAAVSDTREPLDPEPLPAATPWEPVQGAVIDNRVTDAMVDEVTRRVIERLAPGAVNEVVQDIVTRVAERILREEIARLK
jgi:CheY-like chemotaxis protein